MCILAFMIAWVCKQWASYTIFPCSDKILSCWWSGGNCFPFFFGIWYNEEWKKKKEFSVVEGKLNQKKWETYCHFPICVLIPSISLRCQTPLSPPLPLQWHHHCYHCPQHSHHHYHHTIFDAGMAQGQGQSGGVRAFTFLSSTHPTLSLCHWVIMFITSSFSTLLSPPLHQRLFFFFFEKIYLIRLSGDGEWNPYIFFMKKLNIILLSYKSLKS